MSIMIIIIQKYLKKKSTFEPGRSNKIGTKQRAMKKTRTLVQDWSEDFFSI